MAVLSLSAVRVLTSGRTVHLIFTGPQTYTGTVAYVPSISVSVNGSVRNTKINTRRAGVNGNSGGANYITIAITVGAEAKLTDDYIKAGDTVTITAAAGAFSNLGDTSPALTAQAVTNNSLRTTNNLDTLSAAFNEVPWSYLTGTTKIGLIAFENVRGNKICNRVEFAHQITPASTGTAGSVSSFTAVSAMSWNNDARKVKATVAPNGVWEYVYNFNPTTFGLSLNDRDRITIIARIYPDASADYLERQISFFWNAGGTADSTIYYVDQTKADDSGNGLTPATAKKTLRAAIALAGSAYGALGAAAQRGWGAQIEVQTEGTYGVDGAATFYDSQGFIRVYPKAGITARNVVITTSTGLAASINLNARRLRIHGDISVDWSKIVIWTTPTTSADLHWFDGVFFDSNAGNAEDGYRWTSQAKANGDTLSGVHCTNCTWLKPVYAFAGITRSFNNTINQAQADINSNSFMTCNLFVSDGNSFGTTGPHGDGYQDFDNDLKGAIVYGVYFNQAYDYQGMYINDGYDHLGLSIVNFGVNYAKDPAGSGNNLFTQWSSMCENILLMNVTISAQQWIFRSDCFIRGRFTILNSIIHQMSEDVAGTINGFVDIANCHFVTGTLWGSNPRSGSIVYDWGVTNANIGYGGTGSGSLFAGLAITGWNHPGAVFTTPSAYTMRGAFDMAGNVWQDLGGRQPVKPAVINRSTQHPLWPDFKALYPFDEGSGSTARDITDNAFNMATIAGQGAPTWDTSLGLGMSARSPRLSVANTDGGAQYPFQLIWVGSIQSFASDAVLIGTGQSNTSTRYKAIMRGTTFLSAAQYYSSWTRAQSSGGLSTGTLVCIVAQFISDSERRIYSSINGVERPMVEDFTANTGSTASKWFIGARDTASVGLLSSDYVLMAGRTAAGVVWTADEISDFMSRPYAILNAPIAGVASVTATGATTASVTSTPPSGGSETFSHQWHISATNGFIPDGTTAVSGLTGLDALFTGLPSASTRYARLVSTDADGIAVQSNQITITTSGTAPLVAGTISLNSKSQTTANLSSTNASGGSGPYSRQWYLSTTNGFTPGAGNLVAGATTLSLSATGLSPNTTYYVKVVHTDQVAATVTSSQFTFTTDPVVVAPKKKKRRSRILARALGF